MYINPPVFNPAVFFNYTTEMYKNNPTETHVGLKIFNSSFLLEAAVHSCSTKNVLLNFLKFTRKHLPHLLERAPMREIAPASNCYFSLVNSGILHTVSNIRHSFFCYYYCSYCLI